MTILFVTDREELNGVQQSEGSDRLTFAFFYGTLSIKTLRILSEQSRSGEFSILLLSFPKLLDARALSGGWFPCPILVSGSANDMHEAFHLGCHDFLVQPWTRRELEARACRLDRPWFRGWQLCHSSLVSPDLSIQLSPPDAQMLRLLLASPQSAVRAGDICHLLGLEAGGKALAMRLSRLRRTLREHDILNSDKDLRLFHGWVVLENQLRTSCG